MTVLVCLFTCVCPWEELSNKTSGQEKVNLSRSPDLPLCHHQSHLQALFAGKPVLQVDFHCVLVKPFVPNESAKRFSRSG